jgi:hypothetical protein
VLETVNGLPAHPLLAHVVAIFVPLTALVAVLMVFWPAARRRVSGASLFVAAGTLIAIPLTTSAGDWLRQRLMDSEILRRHAALGGQLVFWFALLTIAMVVWWALHTPLFVNEVATLSPVVRRTAIAIVGAATVLLAVVSTWSVVRIGHTGAEAVWGGMTCCKMMGMWHC